jgi:AcrR family transcriptional regulator
MSPETEQNGESGDVDRIVKAAREALGRAGYENLKVKSVIRSAGVSVGSFYRRFRGKQDLMLALLADEAHRNTLYLTEVTAHGTPPERVLAWVDAAAGIGFADRAGARMRWFTSLPSEVRRQTPRAMEPGGASDTANPLRRAIADGIASGDFPNADPNQDAESIRGLCSVAARDESGSFGDNRSDVVAHVTRFIMAALTNPQARSARTEGAGGQQPD